MFKRSLLVAALVLSLTPSVPAQPPEKKAAGDPEKALAVAIKLLEAKDHTGFVKRFMPPAALSELLNEHDIEHIAKKELGKRAEKLLREFNLVKGMKPDFDDERTKATFSTKDADGKSIQVRFTLISGKWYLK